MWRVANVAITVLGVPALACAASVTSVTPAHGSLGTTLTIVGGGFISQPGKAWLMTTQGQKFPLAITSWSETTITAVVHEGIAGPLELVIDPFKSAPGLVTPVVFTLEPPAPAEVQTAGGDGLAQPGEVATLQGAYFGDKAGTLRVGNRRAKVLFWSEDFVQFRVPSALASGMWDVRVKTALGKATLPGGLQLVGGTAKFGHPELVALTGNEPLMSKLQDDAGLHADGTLVVNGLWKGSYHTRQLVLEVPVDPSVQTTVLIDSTTAGFSASYVEEHGGFGMQPVWIDTWLLAPDLPFTLTVLGSGGQRSGTFAGTLRHKNGAETLDVSGSYVVKDLPP